MKETGRRECRKKKEVDELGKKIDDQEKSREREGKGRRAGEKKRLMAKERFKKMR